MPKPVLHSFGTEVKGKYSYEYYAASSAEEAKLYLSHREVTQPMYYIQVETPEGIWGLDKEGLYLVELLPFQTNLSLAQCEGKLRAHSEGYTLGMQSAVVGQADNFVCEITCGSCGFQWKDGVRFRKKTVVKCPACKKYNCVDTSEVMDFTEFEGGHTLLQVKSEI
jgi:hypothetical protein